MGGQTDLAATDGPPGYPIADHNAAWLAASSRLATLSSDSTLTVLEGSDHMIPLRRPEAVETAVLELIEQTRARGREPARSL